MKQKVDRLDCWLYFSLCGLALSLFSTVAGSSIFLGLSILLFFIRLYFRRDNLWEPFKPYRRLEYAYGLFVLAMLLSALFSEDIWEGVRLVISRQVYYVMPCVIVMAIIRNKGKLIMLSKLALLSLLANNVWLFVKAWKNYGVSTIRIDGLVGCMALAAVFSVTIPILYLGISEFKGKWRWICLVACLSSIAGNLLTGTRSGWLASAAVVLVIAFLNVQNKWKLFVSVVLVVACLGGVFYASPKLAGRLMTIGHLNSDSSVTERYKMWQSAVHIWKDYPVFGIGVGQYREAYQTKYCLPDSNDYKSKPVRRQQHPHSNFMLILAEAGVVGGVTFLFFLGLLLLFAFCGWQKTNDALYLVLLSVLLGTQIQGIMDTNIAMTVVCKAYWFFIGLTLQLLSVERSFIFMPEDMVEKKMDVSRIPVIHNYAG